MSAYQTNYIEIQYRLRKGHEILFQCKTSPYGKDEILNNLSPNTLQQTAQLIRDHSDLRFTIPKIFYREGTLQGKRFIHALSMVVLFEK